MTNRGKKYRLWNIIATLITVVVMVAASGKIKTYFVSAQEPSSQSVATEAATHTEGAKPEAASGEGESEDTTHKAYKWINFLLVAGAIYYFASKKLGPFLKARGDAIREDMEKSARASKEASVRLASVEEKMKKLDQEIAALRGTAMQEAAAERVRIEEAAKVDAEKIVKVAEQEISTAVKVARQELKTYAADLAIGVAEKKLQGSISPESEDVIFQSFLKDLTSASQNGISTKAQKGDS